MDGHTVLKQLFCVSRKEEEEIGGIPASIPLGRTHERNVDRLIRLIDVVILAVSLPPIGDYLDHESSWRDHRHVADSRLVRLQIHFDLLVLTVLVLLNVPDVDAGAINRFLFIAPGDDDRQPHVLWPGVGLCTGVRVFVLGAHGNRDEQNQKRNYSQQCLCGT